MILPDVFVGTKQNNAFDYVDLSVVPLASEPTPEASVEVSASDIPNHTNNIDQTADVEMEKVDSIDSEGMGGET